MTVLEIIKRSSEFLARKGVDSARLQVELILSHVLQMPRLKLYLNFERNLTDAEMDVIRKFVVRRGEREPLQQILGSTSFCGYEMAVTRDVLVPRPETEQLAEKAWEYLATLQTCGETGTATGAKAASEAFRPVVLDFGTGSGCLAIVIASKCPAAEVHALDISPTALEVARQNAKKHQTERIQFHLGDGFAALPADLQFDLIVGNPPYISTDEIATLQPEVRDFDPRAALDGGADGLHFYRRIAAAAPAFLKPGGRIMLEFGDGQADAVRQMFSSGVWTEREVAPDLSGRPRILIAQRGIS